MVTTRRRCQIVAAARHRIAEAADELVQLSQSPLRTDNTETVAAELLPLCDALRYLGRRGPAILRSRRVGLSGRPLWLWGVTSHVARVPHGVVLVIGAWNYPLFLAGVQAAQALAAGNAVLWKPAPGTEAVSRRLAECFFSAGVPKELLEVTDSDVATAKATIDARVDYIVLTGSSATGRRVLHQAAEHLTPTTLELSGCDAAIALPSADLDRFINAIHFGLSTSSGATCIGPRRLIATEAVADEVIRRLIARFRAAPLYAVHPAAREGLAGAIEEAIDGGAIDLLQHWDAATFRKTGQIRPLILNCVDPDFSVARGDLFAPVASLIRVADPAEAISVANRSPYALGASVFGACQDAQKVAAQLAVGGVTVNDLVAPTADPRLPFGGRGDSGFGVTRGPEGLLAMTRPQVVAVRHSRFALHLSARRAGDQETLTGALQMQHSAGMRLRLAGLRRLIAGVRTR